jgi:hypothetical protein
VKRVSLVKPFGGFGLAAGLMTASLFPADGCGLSEAESLRLRAGLPALAPALFLGLGWLLARRPWRAARGALAAVLAADAALALGACLLYGGVDALGLVPLAGLLFAGPALGAAIALPPALRAARRATEARAGTAPARSAAALRWGFVAAGASWAGLLTSLPTSLDLPIAWAGCAFCYALSVVAFVSFARAAAAARALRRLPWPSAEFVGAAAAPTGPARVFDAGVGDARREIRAGPAPYRAAVASVWLGDRDRAVARARGDRRVNAALLGLAAAGSLGLAISLAGHRPPPPPKPLDLTRLFGC